MAVRIDTVYQKVLMLTNKEQRGYITPQEFNLFADIAQKEIFEQYFYDLNQFLRVPSNSDEYADIPDNLQEKIAIFEIHNATVAGGVVLPPDLYRLGMVMYLNTIEVEEVQHNELLTINSSPLSEPTFQRPIYTRENYNQIRTYPQLTGNVQCNYTRQPTVASWGYVVVNGEAMYDSANSVNFELHASEEIELVYKILKLAGVSMKRDDVSKIGASLEHAIVQQEKQ